MTRTATRQRPKRASAIAAKAAWGKAKKRPYVAKKRNKQVKVSVVVKEHKKDEEEDLDALGSDEWAGETQEDDDETISNTNDGEDNGTDDDGTVDANDDVAALADDGGWHTHVPRTAPRRSAAADDAVAYSTDESASESLGGGSDSDDEADEPLSAAMHEYVATCNGLRLCRLWEDTFLRPLRQFGAEGNGQRLVIDAAARTNLWTLTPLEDAAPVTTTCWFCRLHRQPAQRVMLHGREHAAFTHCRPHRVPPQP